jgi:hypothetical protein
LAIRVGQLGKTKEGYYPDLTLTEAIDLVRRISDVGGHISRTGLAKIENIDPRGAGLGLRVKDLLAYGFIQENGELQVTPLAQEIIGGNTAKAWEAFIGIPLYAKLHERLRGKEPPDKVVLQNMLYEITKADSDSISRRAMRLKNNYIEALSYFSGGEARGGWPLDSRISGPLSAQQPVQQSSLVTIPRDYATLVTDSFVVGARKDIESLELLEDGIRSWVALWKKQLGAKSKVRAEPEGKSPHESE